MADKAHVIDQIYDKLNELFGTQDQLFCMEFPGRVLNTNTYGYNADSVYSVMTKPQIVLEEEFRLTDDLFDVTQVSGGPNGSKLSTTYDLVLNTVMPKYVNIPDFDADKAKIREWLLEEVTETVDDKEVKCSRMQLFDMLNERYLTAKTEWDQQKSAKLADAKGSNDKLEDYAKWLAAEAPVVEAKLESMFADLVVRGFYHEVRDNYAYLDIKSVAEEIDDAKARLRNSAMSSLDESLTIYPVQLQPTDWFKGLSTDFEPEDLALSADLLEPQLLQKQNELAQLEEQYQSLQAAHTGDQKALKEQVAQAQQQMDDAQLALTQSYTGSVVSVVQIALAKNALLSSAPPPDKLLEDVNNKITAEVGGIPITPEDLDKIKGLLDATSAARQKLNSASRALSELQAQQAAAQSTDTQQQLIVLQSQIDALRSQIGYLKSIIMSHYSKPQKAADGNANGADPVMLPSKMPPAGQFLDVIMHFDTSTTSQNTSLDKGSSVTSASFDCIFGGVGGSSSKSWSDFVQKYQAHSTDFTIGLRAMKVTVDRGGWFNPELFKLTKNMFNLDGDVRISYGNMKDTQDFEQHNKGLFPAFPVAFVVAKDVTLKVNLQDSDIETANSVLNQSSSVGGGFLCFSASHSETEQHQSNSYYSGVDGKAVVIKIPGPQIIGWFLEFVPKDESDNKYSKLPDNYLPKKVANS